MAALVTTANVPHPVQTFYDRLLLFRATPKLLHDKVAQRRPLKRRSGDIIKFRRYEKLSLATTPLVEGVPPTGEQMTYSDVQAQLKQYGSYIPLSDYIQLTIQDPILREAGDLLGEQAGQTLDALLRDVAAAGTGVLYGGAAANRAALTTTTHKVDTSILERAIRALERNDSKRFTKMIGATEKVSTFGVRDAYWAITHPDVVFTLETLAGWKSLEEYSSSGPVMQGEVGAFKNLRFLCSTQAKVFRGGGGTAAGDVWDTGGNADVYTILVFGREAIATVPIEGGNIENIVTPLGSAGAGDPLKQRATSGWKSTRSHVILNDAFMQRIEVTGGKNAP